MMERKSSENTITPTSLAADLRARAGAIIRRWEEAARAAPSDWSDEQIEPFRAGIAAVVEEIAEALADEPPSDPTPPFPGVKLESLARGLGLLRVAVAEETAAGTSRELTAAEILAIDAVIDAILLRWINTATAVRASEGEEQRKLLSFLSHDLRGGLNGVFLMIEIVKRELARHPQFAESVQDLDGARKSMMDTLTTLDKYVTAEKQRRAAAK